MKMKNSTIAGSSLHQRNLSGPMDNLEKMFSIAEYGSPYILLRVGVVPADRVRDRWYLRNSRLTIFS
jgi:hypothetical protein